MLAGPSLTPQTNNWQVVVVFKAVATPSKTLSPLTFHAEHDFSARQGAATISPDPEQQPDLNTVLNKRSALCMNDLL